MPDGRASTKTSIAVIGAGVAGLSAARALVQDGFDVTVFDKARGVGGRTSTRREGDLTFDHGAPFFTARDARFREVLANWCSTGVAAPWRPRVAGGGHDADAGETLHVGIPGMSTLCRSLSAGVMLITGVGVAGARRAGRTWRLQGEYAADLGGFDAVVVATPPRQAAVFLSQARGLLRRIGGVSMAPCWAVMAAFDRRLELDWDVGSFPEDPVSLAVRNSAKPGRTDTESWVLHASPEWTASHLEAEPDTAAGHLLHEFAQRWVGGDLPRRVFVGAHRWRYATATEPLDDGFLWDAATRAGVCADWCRGGGVEDAFLSGLELAQRIAKMR